MIFRKGIVQQQQKVVDIEEHKKKNSQEKRIDKSEEKRKTNRKKLNNKLLDYELELDMKQLKHEKNLKKEKKGNEFKYKEVGVKCDIKNLSLKAGYTLGKICLMLTFISCLLTFGGNIENFICNIVLTKKEALTATFVWNKYTTVDVLKDGTIQHNYVPLGFNLLTFLIYVPFLFGMQTILYQISLCIYIIKTRFKEFYKYSLMLQYSMLFYSVYSNYTFVTYYVKPESLQDKIMCAIPSLLLDVSCIFFLSLSMRMKTLNFDSKEIDKQQNLLIDGLALFDNFRNKKSNDLKSFDDKKIANKSKKESNIYLLKNPKDIDKLLRLKSNKEHLKYLDLSKLKSIGITALDNKECPIKNKEKNPIDIDKSNKEKSNKIGKKISNKSKEVSNKITDKYYNLIKKYILDLKNKNITKVHVNTLLKKFDISKTVWQPVRDRLVDENIIFFSGRTTTIL